MTRQGKLERSGSGDAPLRHPEFRRFLVGRALAGAGGWMSWVAAGYLIYHLTRSAVQVGVLAFVAKGPSIVLGPVGGWLADRFDRRRLVLIYSAAQIPPFALLAILTFDDAISTTEIFVLVFLSALPTALKGPLLPELAPSLVPEPLVKRAMADSAASYNLARLAGPAIGGGLVALIGPSAAFGIGALSFVAVFFVFLSIPAASLHGATQSVERRRLRSGIVVVWSTLLLRVFLATALTFYVFVAPVEQLMPVVAADHGDGAEFIGLLLAALAVGGLVGNPVVRRLQQREVSESGALAVGLILAGALLIGLAVFEGLVLDLATILLLGAIWELVWVISSTGVHFRSPEGLSGQAMGVLFTVVSAAAALGSVLAGWTADLIGLDWSLAVSGVLLILIGPLPHVWVRWASGRREILVQAEQPLEAFDARPQLGDVASQIGPTDD